MRFTNFHEFIPWTGINPSASEQKKIIISNIISNVRCSLFKISWKICFVQGSRDFYNLKKEQGTFDKGGRGGGEEKEKEKETKEGGGGGGKKGKFMDLSRKTKEGQIGISSESQASRVVTLKWSARVALRRPWGL